MDVFDPCYAFQDAELIKSAGCYPFFRVLSASDGPMVTIEGKPVIMLGSNNYLGLTHHPDVLRAAHEAIDRYGTGCTGSRFLNGNLELHESLERELAEFVGKDAALVFSSGFLANAGTLGILAAGDGTVVFSERENHASLIDGFRLARAHPRVFSGADDLERQLSERTAWPNALVVTDAVFSMTGRVIDLRRLIELKHRFGFRLYVDDAHGFGVHGLQGRGTGDMQGIAGDIDILFATFSKSLASMGGFVSGEKRVIDFLRHKTRTLMFSAALAPAQAAAARAALHVMRNDASLFEKLWENVNFYRKGLLRLGYWNMNSTHPIQPVFVGSESLAFRMCQEALELGVFTTPVVFPAVPLGQALIRTSVTPAHTIEQLQQALDVFALLARRFPIPHVDPANLPEAAEMDFSYLFAEPPEEGEVPVAHLHA